MAEIALAHDYVTQRGGAERVVLSMLSAFPGVPLYTAFYDGSRTFAAFADHDVRTLPLDRLRPLRWDHRWGLPLLAPAFSSLNVDADVVLCSSSGWAHGLKTDGRKIVYCHSPARWLYQRDRYLRGWPVAVRWVLAGLAPPLERWDRTAAGAADRYLTNSRAVQKRISDVYGIEASVVHPPHTIDAAGPQEPVVGLASGFVLCVARLMPYKNLDAVVGAFRRLPEHQLVVVGEGRERRRLETLLGANTRLIGVVPDRQLRWLYANCAGLVAASYEDYGLTPLEAAAFGKPTAALRWGGYLDTVAEGTTGVFFDEPDSAQVAGAVRTLLASSWDTSAIVAHADRFSEAAFVARLRAVVAEEAQRCPARR
jgi:glycosyltransferase involved in cell wall biosynthesis